MPRRLPRVIQLLEALALMAGETRSPKSLSFVLCILADFNWFLIW
jgi:hypothetical protein